MKKALFFAGLAAATLTFVGCNKEADYAGNGRKVEIVLSDVATRTINSGMSTEWNAGDELSVFNAAAGTTTWSSNIKFTVQDASANRATGEVELTADAYDWYAFYPYTSKIPNPTTLNPEGSTYERSGYTTVGGQFQTQKTDDNTEHLAGVKVPVFGNVKNVPAGETPVIEMKNAASVVRFKVVNAQEEAIKVLSVKFTAPEDIVGTYYIDFSGTAPTFVGSGENYVFDNVMVTNADPSSVAPDSNADLYAVIKPFTAAAGAKLKVEVEAENADGTKKGTATKEITLTSATEFKPGFIKLLNIPFDVTMTNVTAEELPYEQSFGEGAGDFTIDNVVGSGIWTPGSNSGNNFMKGTSYLSGKNTEGESWLVSPEIDATTASNGVKLSFQHCINKFFGDVTQEATLWAREKGGDWKQFTISYPTPNGTWSSFVEQVVDLSEFKGKIFQFAFKYVGHSTSAGTWEVMDVHVTDAVVTAAFNAELPGADESLSLTVPATTSSVTINVTGNVAWTASASDGATAAPDSGEGAGTVTVSFPANTDPAPKEYSVTVSTDDAAIIAAGGDEFVFTITQEAASTEPKGYPYEESFASSQGDFTIDNTSLPEGLTYVWAIDTKNACMKASAYANGTNYAAESWLISPVVDLATAQNPALTFSHATNYFSSVAKAQEETSVWVREEGGSWVAIEGVNYPTSLGWTFAESGSLDLSAYKGKKVQIGFKYTSTSTKSGTWEIQNFKLDEAAAPTPEFGATLSTPNVPAEASETKVYVTGNVDWTATVTGGATLSAASGNGPATLTVSVPANTDTENTKTYVVTVSTAAEVANKTIDLTITQAKALPVGADDVVFIFSEMGLSNGVAYTSEPFSKDGVDVAFSAGGNNGKYYTTGSGIRVYGGGSVSVSSLKSITKITYVCHEDSGTSGSVSYVTYPIAGDWTISGGTFTPGVTSEWTGSANSVSLTRADGGGHWRIQKIIVTCTGEAATLSSISVANPKTQFLVGDAFSFGGTVTATYSNSATKDVTAAATFAGYDMNQAGNQTVTVSYTEGGVTKTDQYSIQVNEPSTGPVTYTLVITPDDFNTTSYAANNGEHTSTAQSASGETMSVTWKSNQVMKQGTDMQWQKSNAYLESVTNLGTISIIDIVSSAGSFTETHADGEFKISVGSATGKTSKVTITFTK